MELKLDVILNQTINSKLVNGEKQFTKSTSRVDSDLTGDDDDDDE